MHEFSDYIKLRGAGDSLEGQDVLQRGVDRLELWAMVNGMKFNKSKSQIPYLGLSNTRHNYKLGEEWPETALQKGIRGCWSTTGSI